MPKDLHGPILNEAWFSSGAAWTADESRVAYVAEVCRAVNAASASGRSIKHLCGQRCCWQVTWQAQLPALDIIVLSPCRLLRQRGPLSGVQCPTRPGKAQMPMAKASGQRPSPRPGVGSGSGRSASICRLSARSPLSTAKGFGAGCICRAWGAGLHAESGRQWLRILAAIEAEVGVVALCCIADKQCVRRGASMRL